MADSDSDSDSDYDEMPDLGFDTDSDDNSELHIASGDEEVCLFVCLLCMCFTAPRPVVLCWTSRSGGVRFPASGRPEPIPRGMDGAREPLSWAQFG